MITQERLQKLDDLSDEELCALEECLYDCEIDEDESHDTWFLRDQVLWEMNYRGLCNG